MYIYIYLVLYNKRDQNVHQKYINDISKKLPFGPK